MPMTINPSPWAAATGTSSRRDFLQPNLPRRILAEQLALTNIAPEHRHIRVASLAHNDALLDTGDCGRGDQPGAEALTAELRRLQADGNNRPLHHPHDTGRAHCLRANLVVAVNAAKERSVINLSRGQPVAEGANRTCCRVLTRWYPDTSPSTVLLAKLARSAIGL